MGRKKSQMPTQQIRVYKEDVEYVEALAKLLGATYAQAFSHILRTAYPDPDIIKRELEEAQRRLDARSRDTE